MGKDGRTNPPFQFLKRLHQFSSVHHTHIHTQTHKPTHALPIANKPQNNTALLVNITSHTYSCTLRSPLTNTPTKVNYPLCDITAYLTTQYRITDKPQKITAKHNIALLNTAANITSHITPHRSTPRHGTVHHSPIHTHQCKSQSMWFPSKPHSTIQNSVKKHDTIQNIEAHCIKIWTVHPGIYIITHSHAWSYMTMRLSYTQRWTSGKHLSQVRWSWQHGPPTPKSAFILFSIYPMMVLKK